MEKEKDEKNILFVARHYVKGHFSPKEAWKKLDIRPQSWWTFGRVAAALAGVIVLSATATLIIREVNAPSPAPATEQPVAQPTTSPAMARRVIDFDNTPLTDVVKKIHEVYDVEVTDVPANANELRLSIHFEGNAADLIDAINEILDTQMKITEK